MTTEVVDPECLRLAEEAYASDWRKLKITSATSIDMEATEWLWEDGGSHWIPRGQLTLLGGREGVGKTTMAYRIAAHVTRGTLHGSCYGKPQCVIISATEDSWKRTVKPRLAAVGADMTRIFRVEAATPEGLEAVSLPEDTALLKMLVRDYDVALIVLDPLMSVINAKHDTHRDAEVRRALEPVVQVAEDTNAALVGLIHQKKGTDGDLRQRLMASVAFVAVARSVLYCAKRHPIESEEDEFAEPEAGPTYWFGQIKNNLQATVNLSHYYRVKSETVGYDERLEIPITSSSIEFIGTQEENVEDIVLAEERQIRSDKAGSRQQECAAWIRGYLREHGEVMRSEVIDAAREEGFSKATVERSKGSVGLVATQMDGPRNKVSWRLQEAKTVPEKVDPLEPVVPLEPLEPAPRGHLRAVPETDEPLETVVPLEPLEPHHESHSVTSVTESGNRFKNLKDSTPPRVRLLNSENDTSGLCDTCGNLLTDPGSSPDCTDQHQGN